MFNILTGVRQGCVLSLFLFLIVIDFLMRRTVDLTDETMALHEEQES